MKHYLYGMILALFGYLTFCVVVGAMGQTNAPHNLKEHWGMETYLWQRDPDDNRWWSSVLVPTEIETNVIGISFIMVKEHGHTVDLENYDCPECPHKHTSPTNYYTVEMQAMGGLRWKYLMNWLSTNAPDAMLKPLLKSCPPCPCASYITNQNVISESTSSAIRGGTNWITVTNLEINIVTSNTAPVRWIGVITNEELLKWAITDCAEGNTAAISNALRMSKTNIFYYPRTGTVWISLPTVQRQHMQFQGFESGPRYLRDTNPEWGHISTTILK